jgi:hypothetical protein
MNQHAMMNRSLSFLLHSLRLLVLLILLCLCVTAFAQENRNFSGLKNMELRACPGSNEDNRQRMNMELKGTGLPEWGAKPSGSTAAVKVPRIDRFTIIEDQEMELRAEINFSGFSEGNIEVQFVDMDGRVQSNVKTPLLKVTGSSGLLDLHGTLIATGLEPFQILQSGYVKFHYQPVTGEGQVFCFVLPKKWQVRPRNETITVDISAKPIKSASQLQDNKEVLPIPGGVFTPGSGALVDNSDLTQKLKSNKDSLKSYPLGAANQAISLFGMLRSDIEFSDPADISPILLSNIYFDKNPESGIFYYLPTGYNLQWNAQKGFDFKTLYQKGTSTDDGKVNMTVILSPGISIQDNSFAKEFLAAYCKESHLKFTDLTPILPQNPRISLQGSLQSLYGLSSDQINVSNSSSIYEPINASWSTDIDAANEMLTALGQGVGIAGNLSYKSDAQEQSGYSVPINIGLANSYNFGQIDLKDTPYRTTSFANQFPYPIEVNYLHVLVFNNVNGSLVPCIYSYSLGGAEVLSRSKMNLDASRIPAWIDSDPRVKKIWIDYSLKSCTSCTEAVVEEISSGSSDDRVRTIKLNSMGVIRKYDVSFMKVVIRSRFFDPKGHQQTERSFILDKDNTDIEAGPFYVWDEKDLSYEYRIIMLNEEQTYEGTAWTASKDLELYINKGVVKNSLGENLPGSK